jgi:hypothetical protein
MFVGSLHEALVRLSFRLEAEVLALSEVEWAAMEKSPLEQARSYPRSTRSDRTVAKVAAGASLQRRFLHAAALWSK